MDQIGPTPRNTLAGMLADALAKGHAAVQDERKTPLLKAVSNILPVTDWAKTLDRVSYGEPLSTGKGMTTKPHPETMNALMSVPSVIQGARAASPLIQKGATAMARNALAPSNVPMQAQRGAIVYHGSPHTFDKFDMSKIGTGEGAQAYGHGLYFAENPGVAKSYQTALAPDKRATSLNDRMQSLRVGDKPVMDYGVEMNSDFIEAARQGPQQALAHIDERLASWQKQAADPSYPFKDYAKEKIAGFTKLRQDAATKGVHYAGDGSLYKVDLPDEHIAKMLDWDKPLSQQPEALPGFRALAARPDMPPGFSQALESALQRKFDGQDLYTELMKVYKDAPAVSRAMRESGIPGIRYLDQGSRGTGKGTSNYVAFDDQSPKIVERNGKSLTQMLDDALKGSK
jgi:hypothetical protein